MLKFEQWAPDIAQFETAACSDVLNVIPSSTGYRPMSAFVADSPAVAKRPQGIISIRDQSGLNWSYYGDAAKLWRMGPDAVTWTDASRTVGGVYATSPNANWSFAQYGNFIVAANGTDATQLITIGASNFAALAGAPIGKYAGVIREFGVIANLSTGVSKIAWSGIGNISTWTTSATTLADQQELPDGGPITGFVGGEYGVVLQESAIQRMSFEGPPTAFRFDKVSNQLGCIIPRSVAAYENIVFFYSADGFQMLRGGTELTPIGNEKIDRWFEGICDFASVHLASATVDPQRRMYLFSFSAKNAGTDIPGIVLGYHWPSQQWTKIAVSLLGIFTTQGTPSYSVDTLDALSMSLDALTVSLDSLALSGTARPVLSGFDGFGAKGTFSGGNMQAYAETKEFQLSKGKKSLLKGMRPIVEGLDSNPVVNVSGRDSLYEENNDYGETDVNQFGYATCRVNNKYHKIRVTVPDALEWSMLRGIDELKFNPMGAR